MTNLLDGHYEQGTVLSVLLSYRIYSWQQSNEIEIIIIYFTVQISKLRLRLAKLLKDIKK